MLRPEVKAAKKGNVRLNFPYFLVESTDSSPRTLFFYIKPLKTRSLLLRSITEQTSGGGRLQDGQADTEGAQPRAKCRCSP